MKRIITVFLMIVLCFQLLPLSAFAGNANDGILGELAGATVGGEAFDLEDYPKQDGASAELLSFMEKGYAFNGDQSGFGMYVYVYNPSERIIVESGNMITMAVKFDENGVAESFEKFDLRFIEKTENNRFYKFVVEDHVSVHDGKMVSQRVDKAGRRYTVSEIEMKYLGSFLPTASLVGKSFIFTGFEEDKNIAVKTGLVETVELEVKSTYWRSQTSSLGIGHQNQITSVYFSVPNEFYEKYGKLQMIKAAWNEQKTKPILLTSDFRVYEFVNYWLGVNIGEYNSNVPFRIWTRFDNDPTNLTTTYDWTYNVNLSSFLKTSKYVCERLDYLFFTSADQSFDVALSEEDLKKYIQDNNYAEWLFEDSVDAGRIKGYQEKEIYFDKLIDLDSYGDSESFMLQLWLGLTGGNAALFEDIKDISPFYEVQASDLAESRSAEAISDLLYVATDDVDELREAYAQAVANDERLILFRFAQTDYYCDTAVYDSDDYRSGNLAVAQETVFLGFDVISLTFFDDHVSTVIPVSASPIDIVPDITNPYIPEKDNTWKRILMLVFLIVILILCWQPLMKIIDWMVDLIADLTKSFKYQRPKKRRKKRK